MNTSTLTLNSIDTLLTSRDQLREETGRIVDALGALGYTETPLVVAAVARTSGRPSKVAPVLATMPVTFTIKQLARKAKVSPQAARNFLTSHPGLVTNVGAGRYARN